MSYQDLAELDWQICMDYLDDAIEQLVEVSARLKEALELLAGAKDCD